ncbi:MAG TPA: LysM peptidoglycan-binding domain-containing protein [Marinagarivorans sp.]
MPNLHSFTGNNTAESAEVVAPNDHQLHHDPCLIYGDALDAFALPQAAEIWPRIRAGFRFPDYADARISKRLAWFDKRPRHVSAVTQRGELYLHFILEKLDERDLPYELALIPMIESGFDPFAYSYATASGLWQFMPYTGKHLGLEQNWWYDGRRDVTASTEAALTYLSKLNKQFDGDWLLTLAAYNGGQGNVRKAIRKNKKRGKATDFWSLDLPPQTEQYIPKILALKEIILRPDIHNVELPAIANAPYFALADVGGQLDLAQAAKLADVDIDEIYRLNPGFNRWATSPDGPHTLVVPSDKYDGFIQALQSLPSSERVTWERYTIKSGDALSTIAKKYNTSTALLRDINNLKSNTIRAGKTLLVPRASEDNQFYVLSSAQRLKSRQSRGKGTRINYIVRSGDSFWTIARQYKTTTQQLAAWNNMAPRDTLRVGQKLVIWDKSGSATETRKIHYKVKSGDSLARIANKFGVTIRKLEHWNGINRRDILRPGKTLTVHVNVVETSS